MDIGEKLRLLRIRRGLTQEDMADRCELSKASFRRSSVTLPPRLSRR